MTGLRSQLRAVAWACSLCVFVVAGCVTNLEGVKQSIGLREFPVPAPDAEVALELSAPGGLRAVSGELRAIPLKWDPVLVGDVVGYVVERADARDGPFELRATVRGRVNTEFIDMGAWPGDPTGSEAAASETRGLGDGLTAYYRVIAVTAVGNPSPSSAIAVGTTASVPAPPSDLRAYSLQPREVPLSWRPQSNSNVSGYVVYRGPTASGPFEPVAEIAGRFRSLYVDQGLGDLRVLYYRVTSRSAAGAEGPPTPPVRAVTKPDPLPPMGLSVARQTLGANQLTWAPNVESDVTGYRLLRLRETEKRPQPIAEFPSDTTTATDADAVPDQSVSYSVIALDRDGLVSAESTPVAAVSAGYALSAVARSDGVHLSWNPRADEGWHATHIFRGGAFGQAQIGVSFEGEFHDSLAQLGRRYVYSVALVRPDGSLGPASSPVEITIPKP